jgi:hypothetical protein
VPDPNGKNAFNLRTDRHGNTPVICNPALVLFMSRGNAKLTGAGRLCPRPVERIVGQGMKQ